MAKKDRKKFKDTKVGKLVGKVKDAFSNKSNKTRLVANVGEGMSSAQAARAKNVISNQTKFTQAPSGISGKLSQAGIGGKLSASTGLSGAIQRSTNRKEMAARNEATNQPSGITTALNSLFTTNRGGTANIPKSVAPDSPEGIQAGMGEFNLGGGAGASSFSSGTGTGGSGNMGLAGTSTAGAKAALTELSTANDQVISDAEQARLDYEARLKGVDDTKKSWLDKLMGQEEDRESPAELRQNLEEQYDRKAQVEGINALQETLGQAEAQVATQIAATQDKLGSMNFINNQIAQIERNAAPILNKLRADINFKTGLLTQTDALIEQAIQDATAESRERWNRSVQLYNMNSDIFDDMRGDIKEAYKEYMNKLEQEHDDDMKETEWKRDMIIKYGLSNSITDSVESITKAVTRKGGGISGKRFTTSQLNKGANMAGLPLDEFRSIPSDVQNFYVQMTSTQREELNSMFDSVGAGETSLEEAISEIESAGFSREVENYLIDELNSISTPISGGGNFFRNLSSGWAGIRNILSGRKFTD